MMEALQFVVVLFILVPLLIVFIGAMWATTIYGFFKGLEIIFPKFKSSKWNIINWVRNG